MGESSGDCVRTLNQTTEDLAYDRVLVGEDGETVYIEGDVEYSEVLREEDYVQLEDGTFVPADQHPLVPQQARISQAPQRLLVDQGSFQGHRIIQQPTYQSRAPQVSRYKSDAHKATTVFADHFSRNVPQQYSFEMVEKPTVITYPHVSSSSSRLYSSPSVILPAPLSQTSKVKKKVLPGQRKPCNCTKSMCLKLYCDCFANGEFCRDCNCKDCHNNLEHDADRSKAIKQSLERNPNAFKPKIGVKNASGKTDAERLHQKGCHCKKSGCLKNYCECFEAKVPCTSRCKCHGCQNTESDRASRNDRIGAASSALMSLANVASSLTNETSSSPISDNDSEPEPSTARSDPRSYPWFYMTDEVIEAATLCLVAQAEESLSGCTGEVSVETIEEMERMVLGEFGRCLQEIISNTSVS